MNELFYSCCCSCWGGFSDGDFLFFYTKISWQSDFIGLRELQFTVKIILSCNGMRHNMQMWALLSVLYLLYKCSCIVFMLESWKVTRCWWDSKLQRRHTEKGPGADTVNWWWLNQLVKVVMKFFCVFLMRNYKFLYNPVAVRVSRER